MSAFGPPVNGLRTLRIVVVLLAVGVSINTAGIIVTFFLNADRVSQINREREANIIRNCEDVNARHDRSVAYLDSLMRARMEGASHVERARLRESREQTVALIDAITPRRDCRALARRQVRP